LYDPAALRVTAAVPHSVAAQMVAGQVPQIELPGLSGSAQRITPAKVQLLPTVDAATHTVQLRASLPSGLAGVSPGMFARLWLPVAAARGASAGTALTVATAAIVRRAELTGVYVLDPAGKPVLRQVRLGRVDGNQVEVLSGLMPGERVVSDPQAAARVR
jgi:multidrug efflux pump subunit AcrA (membrane-fusion protein)